MKKFSVEIDNLGKIAGDPIVVGGLTVLAGPNATGKTFFSKALYSVFDAMNANHALMAIQARVHPLRQNLWTLMQVSGFEKTPELSSMETQFKQLEDICVSIIGKGDEIAAVEKVRQELSEAVDRVIRAHGEARPDIEKFVKSGKHRFGENALKSIDNWVERLGEITTCSSDAIVSLGFMQALYMNLVGNFQAPDLADLRGDPEKGVRMQIDGIGEISLEADFSQTSIESAGLARLQAYSRVIYLESPIHWKLRGAIKNYAPRFPLAPGSLNIPKYFTDLDRAFNDKYPGKVAFPELLKRLTVEVLRGKIVIDESGELMFAESGQTRPFSLPMTATGMVNLGILALLIERKILDKGTFLFIDEPETNLHPQWQVEMIEVLFELAQAGVHVVIATHSSDIMERLAALVKQNPGSKDMVALNHFSADGVKNGGKDFDEKMGDIIEELTDAFADSYMMKQE